MRYVHQTGCRRHREFGSISEEIDRVKAVDSLACAIALTDIGCCDRGVLRQFQLFADVII